MSSPVKTPTFLPIMSPFIFLSYSHPFRFWFLLNLSLASGLFISSYSFSKGYLLLLLADFSSTFALGSFLSSFLLVLGLIYPLLWIWLVYPLFRAHSYHWRFIPAGFSVGSLILSFWILLALLLLYFSLFFFLLF